MILGLNHIGICVERLEEMIPWLEERLEAKLISVREMPDRGQRSAILELRDGSRLELMDPLGDTGTVASFLQKRGEGIHHISLRVDDLDKTCEELAEAGARIIGKGNGIAFVHPKTGHGVLWELSDGSFSQKENA